MRRSKEILLCYVNGHPLFSVVPLPISHFRIKFTLNLDWIPGLTKCFGVIWIERASGSGKSSSTSIFALCTGQRRVAQVDLTRNCNWFSRRKAGLNKHCAKIYEGIAQLFGNVLLRLVKKHFILSAKPCWATRNVTLPLFSPSSLIFAALYFPRTIFCARLFIGGALTPSRYGNWCGAMVRFVLVHGPPTFSSWFWHKLLQQLLNNRSRLYGRIQQDLADKIKW